MQQQQFQIGGRSLNYATTGADASAIVCLHGVTRRWQSYRRISPALAAEARVFALDFRGHGRSDAVDDRYRVIDYVDDALALIDELHVERVVVYGHSLGAMVAALVAAKRPDQVSAIIMEDPPFHTMGNRIAETPLLSLFQAMQKFSGDRRNVSVVARELADSVLHDPATGKATRLGDVRDAASLRFTAACLKKLDPNVLKPVVAGEWLAGLDIEQTCRNVRCPALLLQADTSAGGMLPDDVVELLRPWFQDLTHVKVTGCGHLIHWSRTEELLSHVFAFLGSLEP